MDQKKRKEGKKMESILDVSFYYEGTYHVHFPTQAYVRKSSMNLNDLFTTENEVEF